MKSPMPHPRPQIDIAARWWFLTKEGFASFKDDPVSQGYEILSRHPHFPHLRATTERREETIIWEHGNPLPKKTWQQLAATERRAFLFRYKSDLHKMGLLEIASLDKATVTFNCTEGVPSILAAIHYWLGESGLFIDEPDLDPLHTRYSGQLRVSYPPNPEMVTIDWSDLIQKRKGSVIYGQPRYILSPLRTFLETNPDYLRHRNQRLTELKAGKRLPRLQRPAANVIALACAANDCQQEGISLLDELKTTHLENIGRGRLQNGDSRNHMRRLRGLQRRAGFRTSPKVKVHPHNQDTIDVVEILYPSFKQGK
jgi:hypothetical protein